MSGPAHTRLESKKGDLRPHPAPPTSWKTRRQFPLSLRFLLINKDKSTSLQGHLQMPHVTEETTADHFAIVECCGVVKGVTSGVRLPGFEPPVPVVGNGEQVIYHGGGGWSLIVSDPCCVHHLWAQSAQLETTAPSSPLTEPSLTITIFHCIFLIYVAILTTLSV